MWDGSAVDVFSISGPASGYSDRPKIVGEVVAAGARVAGRCGDQTSKASRANGRLATLLTLPHRGSDKCEEPRLPTKSGIASAVQAGVLERPCDSASKSNGDTATWTAGI